MYLPLTTTKRASQCWRTCFANASIMVSHFSILIHSIRFYIGFTCHLVVMNCCMICFLVILFPCEVLDTWILCGWQFSLLFKISFFASRMFFLYSPKNEIFFSYNTEDFFKNVFIVLLHYFYN